MSCEGVLIIPRHPAIGMFGDFRDVELQLIQIVKRIDAVEFAGIDQAHVNVADASSVAGLVEQGILAVMLSLALPALCEVRDYANCRTRRHVLPREWPVFWGPFARMHFT